MRHPPMTILYRIASATLLVAALAGEETATPPVLTLGASTLYAHWSLGSQVDSDVNTIGNESAWVDYNIKPSWLRSWEVAAHWKAVRLGISVAEQLDTPEAATYASLAGALDYLVADQRWLRVIYEAGELAGTATFHREDGYSRTEDVETTWRRMGCLYGNGAWMAGLTYEDQRVPVAMGYLGPAKSIVYSDFVPDARWRLFQITGGYDHDQLLSERGGNYMGLTGTCTAGFGFGWFHVPQSFVKAAEADTPFQADDDATGFALSLDASLGYAVQGSLGWATGRVSAGARARWVYTTTAPVLEESNAPDDGSMWLLIEYQQLMWGPYIAASLSF